MVLNLLVISVMGLSLLWRRDRPLVPVVCCGIGMPLAAAVLTAPPYIFVSIAMMATASYSAGAHLERRQAIRGLALVLLSLVTVVLIFDPSDWFFPIAIFGVVPWLAGRTIRTQTMLARELAEKAERAEHAREEEERRAIARGERSRIARELHDVLAHNLSVMVVQAGGARRIVEKRPDQAAEVADLIERTGRETLAELRHLFGPVRHGEGEDLHGPVGIDQVEELAARARAAGLRGARARGGRPGVASHGGRPDRLPRRAGGAHQHPEARGRRAGQRHRLLRAERARALDRGRRREPGRRARGARRAGRRPRPRRDARARRALRRAAAGRQPLRTAASRCALVSPRARWCRAPSCRGGLVA